MAFKPDYAVPVGDLIAEKLGVIGMKKRELAALCLVTPKHISRVINGHEKLSMKLALEMEEVLDYDAELLLRMDLSYWLFKEREKRK